MSSFNLSLLIGALVVLGLYVANALVYRRRFGTFLRSDAKSQLLAKDVSLSQLAVAVAVVVAGLAGVAAPVLAPESAFARWLQEPFSLVLYAVWCFILGVVAGSLSSVLRTLAIKS